MKPRYNKVWRDLVSDYPKNLMLAVAIAIGVFGIGAILGGYAVISREMKTNYMGTNPASATIELEQNISSELVDSVRKFPGIVDAERRTTPEARMKVGDKWYPLLLFTIDDFAKIRMNKFQFLHGNEPAESEMLVERTALALMNAKEGQRILVQTANGAPKEIKISGVVHDPGLAPAWQEQTGFGYITIETLEWLGESPRFDQLRIIASDQRSSDAITRKASELAIWLKNKKYGVHQVQVPPPGKHPHQSQMKAVLSIFTTFAFLILILGSILVAVSMATLMMKQVRQIGVMKTIGAGSTQMAAMYFMMMMAICLAALLIGVPLSRVAAAGLYNQIANLLNLEITDTSIPGWVLLTQIGSGIFIPLIAAAVPVIRGSRISIRKALDNYGLAGPSRSRMWRFRGLGEVFTLSFRNVFRQRPRLVMTLGLLAAGGAMFMTALNVSEAWNANLKRIYQQRQYDLEVKLNNTIALDSLLKKIRLIDGVKQVEGWCYQATAVANADEIEVSRTYPDKGHGSFTMLALPVSSKLLNPTVIQGSWLKHENVNQVVLNQMVLGSPNPLKVGDEIRLSLDGKPHSWRIVGFTEDVGSGAAAYVPKTYFEKITNTVGRSSMLRVSYIDRSRENAIQKNKEVERLLESERVSVSASIPVWLLQNAIAAHMKVLVNSLLAMAVLMAVVGTLALLSTMSINVMERTREIGVMRAIGATPSRIRSLIAWEGMIIGVMSISVALALALVFSTFMGRFIGFMAFKTPLSLIFSKIAFAIWTGIIIIGSFVATVYPSRRAVRLSTREALNYE
jgi:putative ABC transport system permease protein